MICGWEQDASKTTGILIYAAAISSASVFQLVRTGLAWVRLTSTCTVARAFNGITVRLLYCILPRFCFGRVFDADSLVRDLVFDKPIQLPESFRSFGIVRDLPENGNQGPFCARNVCLKNLYSFAEITASARAEFRVTPVRMEYLECLFV